MKIGNRPSVYGVSLKDIKVHYRTIDFIGALARYVIHCHNSGFSWHQVENAAADFYIPFHKLSVFHRIKFLSQDPFSTDPSANIVVDSIHCEASQSNKHGTYLPGQFDTAIIKIESGGLSPSDVPVWLGLKAMALAWLWSACGLTNPKPRPSTLAWLWLRPWPEAIRYSKL